MPPVLILYCATVAFCAAFIHGGMFWHDSPEFIMTSFFLLPSHPAGSPAYSLVAHVLTWLPIGPIPARVALLSTISSGLIVATLAHWAALPSRSTPRTSGLESIPTAVFLGGAFVTSVTLRTYALVPEVYPFHAAMLATAFGLVATVPGRRGTYAGAMALGIAACVHFSTLFYLPLFFSIPRPARGPEAAAARRHEGVPSPERRGGPWSASVSTGTAAPADARTQTGSPIVRRILSTLPVVALGYSTHLFLALRSIPDAPLYWGDLSQPARLLGHLLGTSEYGYLWRLTGSDLPPEIQEFLRKLAWEYPWSLLTFAGLGLVYGLKSRLRLTAAILLGSGLQIVFFMRFESFPAQYYLIWAVAAFAAGIGSRSVLELSRVPVLRAMVGATVVVLAVVLLYQSVEAQSGFRTFSQEASVDLTVDAVPPNGALVDSGQFVFQANYLSSIEHRRPDIRYFSLLREGLTEPDQLRIILPHLSERRPTTLRTDIDTTLFSGAKVAGPVFLIRPHPSHPSFEVLGRKWVKVAERFASPPPPDLPTSANIARITASQARWHLWNGRTAEAKRMFEMALAIQPRYATAIEGLGRVAELEGRTGDAIRLYRNALDRLSPTSPLRQKYLEALSKAEAHDPGSGKMP
ncbi:MAG: DUF2723 domain-containing protein [Nitrospirae bacterium]|nr:DUF2723 domain-containing protein [Nitrospirota bacterium]